MWVKRVTLSLPGGSGRSGLALQPLLGELIVRELFTMSFLGPWRPLFRLPSGVFLFVYIQYQGFSVVLEGMEEAFRVCRVGVEVQPSTDMTRAATGRSTSLLLPTSLTDATRRDDLVTTERDESPDSPISLQREDWTGASFPAYHVFPTIMLYDSGGLTTNDWWWKSCLSTV